MSSQLTVSNESEGSTRDTCLWGAVPSPPGAALANWPASTHRHCIRVLAEETGRSLDEIAPLYYTHFVNMAAHAVVFDYLPLLVTKRIRNLFHRRNVALPN